MSKQNKKTKKIIITSKSNNNRIKTMDNNSKNFFNLFLILKNYQTKNFWMEDLIPIYLLNKITIFKDPNKIIFLNKAIKNNNKMK